MAELLGIPAGFGVEALLALIRAGVHIQLGAIKLVPLEPEAFGVVVRRAEAGNSTRHRKNLTSGGILEAGAKRLEKILRPRRNKHGVSVDNNLIKFRNKFAPVIVVTSRSAHQSNKNNG